MEHTFHIEPMEPAELAFLEKSRKRQSVLFARTLLVLVAIGFIAPVAVGLFLESIRVDHPDSPWIPEDRGFPVLPYLLGAGVLILLVVLAGYYSYTQTLSKLSRDLREKNKVVEKTEITRKVFMPHNSTFHFYLSSPTRLSIEVEADDYKNFREGDEINLEYSKHARIYFGYF